MILIHLINLNSVPSPFPYKRGILTPKKKKKKKC